jgi:hypothetical protein
MKLFSRNRRNEVKVTERRRFQPEFRANEDGLEQRDLMASLVPGGIVSGSISKAKEVDTWTFKGSSGQTVEIMTSSTPSQGWLFSAYTDLYSPSGTLIRGFWPGSNIRVNLNQTGTYSLKVRDTYSSYTGSYNIGMETLKPASPDAKTLTSGRQVSGTLNSGIQKDQWIIDVAKGKKLRVALSGTGHDRGYRVYLDIYSPSGELVGGMWDGTNTFTFNKSGKYILQVRETYGFYRGSYRMTATIV